MGNLHVARVSGGKARILLGTYSGDAGFEEPLNNLSAQSREAMGRIEDLMTRQGRFLEQLATDELVARLRRVESYASKARFGLADSKDRIARQDQQ